MRKNLRFLWLALAVFGAFACGGTDADGGHEGLMPENVLSDFSDLSLAPESAYIGADGSGGFESGALRFKTQYNSEYKSWDGFAYANQSNQGPVDFANLSAMNKKQDKPGIYAVGFVNCVGTERPTLMIAGDEPGITLNGLLVSNTSYTYHVIQDGNAFAKKFGGADGTDADWFLLTISALAADGSKTGKTVEVYLADYRPAGTKDDFILDDWTFVDLSSLGPVKGLSFDLSSSDVGQYGMNTPTFFAIDDLTRRAVSATAGANE